MAVKFAVYETMRHTYVRLTDKQPGSLADLLLGGTAGAAAAAATTPVDVVKTVMMCNASSRPTITGAVKQISAQGKGVCEGGVEVGMCAGYLWLHADVQLHCVHIVVCMTGLYVQQRCATRMLPAQLLKHSTHITTTPHPPHHPQVSRCFSEGWAPGPSPTASTAPSFSAFSKPFAMHS